MEFAFILPVLLVLLYGILVYGIVLVTQQAVAYGAQRGAEAAVVVNPEADNYLTEAGGVARAEVRDVIGIGFLPGWDDEMVEVLPPEVPDGSALGQELRVIVEYPFSNWGLPAPAFLPLPDTLTGEGVLRVGP